MKSSHHRAQSPNPLAILTFYCQAPKVHSRRASCYKLYYIHARFVKGPIVVLFLLHCENLEQQVIDVMCLI